MFFALCHPIRCDAQQHVLTIFCCIWSTTYDTTSLPARAQVLQHLDNKRAAEVAESRFLEQKKCSLNVPQVYRLLGIRRPQNSIANACFRLRARARRLLARTSGAPWMSYVPPSWRTDSRHSSEVPRPNPNAGSEDIHPLPYHWGPLHLAHKLH